MAPPAPGNGIKKAKTFTSLLSTTRAKRQGSLPRQNTASSSISRNDGETRLANSIHYPPEWPKPDGIFDAVRRLIHGYDLVCHMLVDTELSKKPFVFRAFRRRLVLPPPVLELYNALQDAIFDIETRLSFPLQYHAVWKARVSSGWRMNGELESAQDSLQFLAEGFYSKILNPIKLAMLQKIWIINHDEFLRTFKEDYGEVLKSCETVQKALHQITDDAKPREAGDATSPHKKHKMPDVA
ncbi:uncharacterized protein C8A04DRAFT_25917 [Dichotomopilus funicola]|uniref:Uncharacterized protein n=1 Tax=Dichotomopilus funicola TaxID=1934379 RepID=A0AAN6ZQ29_9PEZI|nr:hypothetical protein C8A04DRAFT_25917 [Dichotomopilus funicola]